MEIKDFIDLHVHIGPEPIPRKFNVDSIIKEESGKIKGLALKNHFYSTSPFIKDTKTDLILIGSVTLNNYVGGLNPDVIYATASILDNPIIVWFPTINSQQFLRNSKYEIPPEWIGGNLKSRLSKDIKPVKVLDENNELKEDTRKVLKAIKENDCILATGHLSYKESEKLVEEAVKMGIKRIIVTHPIYPPINMPIEMQKKLSRYEGVYMEQTFAMYLIDKIPIEKIAEQIKQIGAENCIISTDVGQINSPSPSKAMEIFTELLLQNGISKPEILIMGKENPLKLITKETLLNSQNLLNNKKEELR